MGDTSSPIPFGQKRTIDHTGSHHQSQMKSKRIHTLHDISDSDMNDSIDNMTSDDIFLPQAMQPQVTINESPRFDSASVKRESNDASVSQPQSPSNSYRTSYRKLNHYKVSNALTKVSEIPCQTENPTSNSLQSTSYPYNFSDFSSADMSVQNEMKPSAIHMDIPAGEK